MSQDISLFNDTIAYNIGYGLPGATTAQIEEAAKAAQVHHAISGFTEGYATQAPTPEQQPKDFRLTPACGPISHAHAPGSRSESEG